MKLAATAPMGGRIWARPFLFLGLELHSLELSLELSAPIRERLGSLVEAAVAELTRIGFPPRPIRES